MKIMGAEVEKPVEWVATTAAGIAWPVYLLAGSPAGTPGDYLQVLLYFWTGLVAVRLVAFIVLLLARRTEVKS